MQTRKTCFTYPFGSTGLHTGKPKGFLFTTMKRFYVFVLWLFILYAGLVFERLFFNANTDSQDRFWFALLALLFFYGPYAYLLLKHLMKTFFNEE